MAPTQIRDTTPSDGALPAPDIAEQEGTDHESLDKQSVVNDPEQTLGLETAASVLAKAHAVVMQPGSYTWFVNRVQQYKSTLQHVYDTITVASKEEALLSYGAEWILDNFYIVQRVLRQIDEDMPEAYYRQLPKLTTTPNQGLPRVYAIAAGIIAQTDLHIDEDRIQRFVLAYQEAVPPSETPLTMGELWALSPMLRFVLLDHLSHAAANIANIDAKFSTNDGRPSDGTLAGDIIANAILGLRLLAVLDWKLFFEEVSTVEKILRRDPIGIYAKMDFETRNAYRKDIESIARMTKCSEVEIASAAIELAGDAGTAQPRFSHVGTYLIGDGKRLLEDKIGHGPSLLRHLQRWFVDHPTFVYLGSIGLLPLLTLYGVVGYTDSVGGSWLWQVGAAILVLLPLLTTSVTLINWLITTFTPPHVLPKLDFAESIPPDCRTMVVVPSMITSEDEVDALLRQLEQHFLGNPDLQLTFALLTDWADAPQEQMPNDEPLLKKAKDGIQTLNLRYASDDGRTPFYLFHRARCWNAGENAWMGWERKRGKLDEFNRLLAGDASTTYIVQEGDRTILPEIKYVITLDADTVLPSATAHRLVGALAHPLNQAEFDAQSGRVVTGYTVLQPRTEIKPTSASRSRFTKIYAGDTGLDLYTLAVSDIYQDLFGEGIYTGKGIYDVAAFRRSLDGRVPNNHILSHDLFEGIHGRAGLLSDVVLYEELPTSYLNYALRSHRWVRGDWQLLPWLFSRVPLADGSKQPNRLSLIDRWKIHDNLCRSLFAPALLTLLVAGWLWMPGSPLVWTLVALLALFSSAITGLIGDVLAQTRESKRTDHGRSLRLQVKRSLLAIVFLPYEASIAADAIVRTITRLIKTRHHLLQWRTAAHTARATRSGIAASWQQMRLSPLLAILIGMAVVGIRPSAILLATPFIFSWVFAPQIAFWISRPTEDVRAELSASQHQSLRCLARRTWLYTEHFVSPDDNWLPPDHFQEAPRGQVAHRTSPTNVGLALLSTLAAYDLGYVGLFELSLRLQNTFDELAKLERHRGHFLNWIDTRTLEPLPPRYVSTVDSGNLAGCLLALSQGCQALSHAPLFRWSRWQDLIDLLTILDETLANASVELLPVTEPLRNHIAGICAQITAARTTPQGWIALLYQLRDKECRELDRLMLELVADHEHTLDADLLHSLRIWMERVHHHLNNRPREIEHLLPWLISFREPPALFNMPHIPAAVIESWQNLVDLRPTQIALNEVVDICLTMQEKLAELQKDLHKQSELTVDEDQELWIAADQWCATLATKLEAAKNNASNLFQHYHALSQLAETYVAEMDFQFLFDERRQLFHIGYNVESGQLDANYYDLLASEARIASLIAIAKQDVPQSHWLHMARPQGQFGGDRALLSWSGTMFEYLMPMLLLRQYENTFLRQSNLTAVQRQVEYAREKNVPWGISESGYYRFDANMNHQYRAFGVPGLGFKRGLGDDLVVAPYASLLALPIRPDVVMQNVKRFIELDMLGDYGFYEAVDYTPSRLTLDEGHAIVRSFMVHHQGMILLSLVNYLQDNVMVRRFHADPRIQSVELLLQEMIPLQVPIEQPPSEAIPIESPGQPTIQAGPWHVPVHTAAPQAHFLSNGRYGVLITSTGGGYSCWEDVDLTRWRADTTLDDYGTWLYVQDLESKQLWSIGHQPVAEPTQHNEVFFYPHQVDFICEAHDIATDMTVTVAPRDDVEIRRIRVTNQSTDKRHLALTSYSEPILAAQDADRRHPAFNKLFIESEYLPHLNAILLRRRPRANDEEPLYLLHALVIEPGEKATIRSARNRATFLGRGRIVQMPVALAAIGETKSEMFDGPLSASTVATLDPIMALRGELELEGYEALELSFITLAAHSREDALALAERYQNWATINRAFDQARNQSERELRQLDLTSAELEQFQKLLSVLLYPHEALRAVPETLVSNRLGQPALWPYAISGDYPILLVKVGTSDESALVSELLQAHSYWRNRRLKIDLVILNEEEIGYTQEVQGELLRVLTRTGSDSWLNQRGGIFLLNTTTMSNEDRVLLETAARAILYGDAGTLARQLRAIDHQPTYLPPLMPTRSAHEAQEPTPSLLRPADLLFDNGIGGFTQDGKEYVIHLEPEQWTPAPWINVIANPDFGFLISEAGSGNTWSTNSGENRLTPWSNDPVSNTPGEALYLRDEETGAVWSPTPLPARSPAPYQIRHGAGYTDFAHHSHGLKQRVRFFVAPDAPVKIAHVRIENSWQRARRLTATYYTEWVLGVNRDTMQQYIIPEYEDASHALLARNPYNPEFGERVAFVAASKELHGLTANRTEFLGRTGNRQAPAALQRIGLSNVVSPGHDPCAALQIHVDLEPGQAEEFYFLIGQEENREKAVQLIQRFQKPGEIDETRRQVIEFWDGLLGTITVDTPDAAMNIMLNRWLLYQALACRIWGRTALYQSSGAYGFRDQLQDVMALLHAATHLAREQILRTARHQFETGDVLHWWHPPSGRGVRTRISDDLLWLPFVTAHYVSTTGDKSILTEDVPFLRGPVLGADEHERYGLYETTDEIYSIYEHCRRAIAHGRTEGVHGLPLMGGGDWNDGMNRVGIEGRGESVWLGWFLHATMMRFASICRLMNDEDEAETLCAQAETLRRAIEESAWDGNWYRRGFYDDGSLLGSAENNECQIDAIAQSWAVLSGAGDEERVTQAMDAIRTRLVQPDNQLIQLFTPPFDKSPRDPGYIKGYPPGIRENGGQYTHAAIWTVWAFAQMGDGDFVEELFHLLNPIYHAETAEKAKRYQVEPYVIAADVYGVPPHIGRGGWTWYTGSCGWMYQLGIETILGVRREGSILRVAPLIPKNWPSYEFTYRYGRSHYRIRVENPNGLNGGVAQVVVDEKEMVGDEIPLMDDGQIHSVTVYLRTELPD